MINIWSQWALWFIVQQVIAKCNSLWNNSALRRKRVDTIEAIVKLDKLPSSADPDSWKWAEAEWCNLDRHLRRGHPLQSMDMRGGLQVSWNLCFFRASSLFQCPPFPSRITTVQVCRWFLHSPTNCTCMHMQNHKISVFPWSRLNSWCYIMVPAYNCIPLFMNDWRGFNRVQRVRRWWSR